MKSKQILVAVIVGLQTGGFAVGQDHTEETKLTSKPLARALLLHASFDAKADADFSKADGRLFSSTSTKRGDAVPGLAGEVKLESEGGVRGGCLHFTKKGKWFPFFKGRGNFSMPQKDKPFSGTVSFWMKLDPAKDLEPGFVDPIQITDKKWNDASFFLDFTKENPRQFRLGAYSNYKHWNPKALKYDAIPDSKRPLGAIRKLPFSRQRWTHVAFTWKDFNTGKPSQAVMFLDGKKQAEVKWPQQFDWEPDKVGIMLGIGYVGRIDELTVFSRPLGSSAVNTLFRRPESVSQLYTTAKSR